MPKGRYEEKRGGKERGGGRVGENERNIYRDRRGNRGSERKGERGDGKRKRDLYYRKTGGRK